MMYRHSRVWYYQRVYFDFVPRGRNAQRVHAKPCHWPQRGTNVVRNSTILARVNYDGLLPNSFTTVSCGPKASKSALAPICELWVRISQPNAQAKIVTICPDVCVSCRGRKLACRTCAPTSARMTSVWRIRVNLGQFWQLIASNCQN